LASAAEALKEAGLPYLAEDVLYWNVAFHARKVDFRVFSGCVWRRFAAEGRRRFQSDL